MANMRWDRRPQRRPIDGWPAQRSSLEARADAILRANRTVPSSPPASVQPDQSDWIRRRCNVCGAYKIRIWVSDGILADGTLHIRAWCSKKHSALDGFSWAIGPGI